MKLNRAFSLRIALATTVGLASSIALALPQPAPANLSASPATAATSAAPSSTASIAARDAIAQREMLVNISTRLAASESRARASEEFLAVQQTQTKWIAVIGAASSIFLALMAGFGGFYLSKHLEKRRERELLDAGKEPLAILITKTRDDATRLAQRLQIGGQTNTRLFRCIMDALPALQVEAGKATFNLSKQIPKAEHSRLEGTPTPLDPLRAPTAPTAIS